METTSEWRSPRRVEVELRNYQRARFEAYMRMEDDGTITRALAISALRDEMESGIWTPDGEEATIQNNQVSQG